MNSLDKSMPTKDELFEFISKHEGIKPYAYIDSQGYMSIGIGFNLDRRDARTIITKLKLDYDALCRKEQKLTDKATKELFNVCLQEAIQASKSFVSNFDELPHDIKLVLIDMAFNLGATKLNKFVNFKAAINHKAYKLAAIEMKNSRWYDQVKSRGEELVNIVLSFC